jgi:putative protein kinase ArgK-like GTPase of G3E family
VARFEGLRKSGELTTLRQAQLEHALSSALSRELLARLRSDPRAAERLGQLRAAVGSGQLLPTTAARQVVEQVFGR